MFQRIKYVLKKIREKGIYQFALSFYKLITYDIYIFICYVIGIFAYPFCLAMNVRFLNVEIAHIGNFCAETECYLKETILGLQPKYNAVILAPHRKVANLHLLSYWKRYIKIISSPLFCALLDPLQRNRLTRFNVTYYLHRPPRYDFHLAYTFNESKEVYSSSHVGFPKIEKEYFGRPPLLSLTELDYKRGWAALRELGMPQGAWFVCVHCRESGFYPQYKDLEHRNANINNYYLAMEAIVERGGWVIRMGDTTMKNIPQMDHVFDYAHSDLKSDWMDIFLCASCKFFLGSSSGLSAVSSVFGVPVVSLNHAPIDAVLVYTPCDIGVPKLVRSVREERYLGFKEVFSSKIGSFLDDNSYSKAGVKLIENSPEDIKDAAMEMLDRVEGKALYTDEDERLQEHFKSLMNPSHYSYGSSTRVGRDFLRKYAFLLNE